MNTEKLEKLKKSLDNKFVPDNMKDKIRKEIAKLESEIKKDEVTPTEIKEEIKEIEVKVEEVLEVAEKKEEQAEAKKTSTKKSSKTSEPKPTAMSLAKEIRKEGESWKDAQERARKIMKEKTQTTTKNVESELEKLNKLVRSKKELRSQLGKTDLLRDSQRKAKPMGRRISKDGNVYYENRANRTDRGVYGKLYLAEGGYLTDPTFGTFQNQVFAYGGGFKSKSVFRTNNSALLEYANFTDGSYINLIKLNRTYKSGYSFAVSVQEFKDEQQVLLFKTLDKAKEKYDLLVTEAKEDKTLRNEGKTNNYELGGTIVTDLAGHTGGSLGGDPTMLDGMSGTHYTGLVGETGAMSSGEMFMNGGTLPEGVSQPYMITESLGNPAQHFAIGGSIRNQYKGRTAEDIWNNWTPKQREHFLADHYDVLNDKSDLNSKDKSFNDLDIGTQIQLKLHIEQGQYAVGGGVGDDDYNFNRFISSQINYIISLKTISQKKAPIKSLLENMDDYRSGSDIQKRITTDNLKYALQQKTSSKMNEVLKISLNALKFEDGGALEKPYNVAYLTKSGKGYVAHNIMAVNEEEAKEKLIKQMRASSTFDRVVFAHESFEQGGFMNGVYADEGAEVKDEEVVYFINKDGVRVHSVAKPEKELSEAEWLAKHNESKEARAYGFGGLFGKNPMMSRKNVVDLDEKQVRLKSGEYVQVLDHAGDSLMVMDLSKLGTGATPKMIRLSDVDMTSFAKGGGVGLIGNQKRIDMNHNGKIDAEDFKLLRSSMNGASRNERKYVNHEQDYEVRYARKTPNRTGYKGKRNFATGGGISNFERLSRVVSKNYEGKRVKPKYQKEYGKVYSKSEAKEVGDKVAGKVKAMQKAESGASVKKGNRGGVMLLAKQIRKEGESWKDAMKRASQQLK